MTFSFKLADHALNNPSAGGNEATEISFSPDGRYLLFSSQSSTISGSDEKAGNTDYFVYDTTTGAVRLVDHTRMSTTTAANGDASLQPWGTPYFSPDGHHILFYDNAADIAGTDTNTYSDLFVYDADTGVTKLVSHNTASSQDTTANGGVGEIYQNVSADGRYILVQSSATDMATHDSNGLDDFYIYDVQDGSLDLVDHAPGDRTTTVTGYAISGQLLAADGAHAAYELETITGGHYVNTTWVYSVADGTQVALTAGAYHNTTAEAFSPDGRYLLYDASTGQSGDSNPPPPDLRLYDTQGGTDVLVSHAYGSATTAADSGVSVNYVYDIKGFSPDSHSIVLQSGADNLAGADTNGVSDIFVYDVASGNVNLVTHAAGSPETAATYSSSSTNGLVNFSPDSRFLLYSSFGNNIAAHDTNNGYDYFLYDTVTHNNLIVGVEHGTTDTTSDGNGSTIVYPNWFSPDSHYLFFATTSTNVAATDTDATADEFVLNLQDGTTHLVSHAVGAQTDIAVGNLGPQDANQNGGTTPFSADGRYLLLESQHASSIAGNDNNGDYGTDLFLYDTTDGSLKLVSHSTASNTATANGSSHDAVFTPDSTSIVFESEASNLVAGDTNTTTDVFIYDIATGNISIVSQKASGGSASSYSDDFLISPDGTHLVLSSQATDLNGSNRNTGSGADIYVTSLTPAGPPPPNQPPSAVTLDNALTTIGENTSTATHIKLADIDVTDDGQGTNTLGLAGADAGSFEIVGTALYLKAGVHLDYETKASYAVTVTVDDTSVGSTPDLSTNYTLTVGNVSPETLVGTTAAEVLVGGSDRDIVYGLDGNDILLGQGNNDVLIGGAGQDTLYGGLGADTFVFNFTSDSLPGATHDLIVDFVHAQGDRIDLSAIDANVKLAGNQLFHLVAAKHVGHGKTAYLDYSQSFQQYHHTHAKGQWAGALRITKAGLVQGDVNGDGHADFEISVPHTHLVRGDFLL